MGKADWEGGGGGIDGALLAAASPSRCGMEGSGLSEEPSRRGRSGWVRVHKMWVRKPHVGATRGGRSCGSGRGEEDPTELKAESLDPKMPVPLREAGETPASGHLARPPSLPFPSRALGGGDRARSLGRDEAGPVPALAAAAPRALFTPAPGGATAGPARSAPTQGPRRPKWPGGLGRSPSFHFPSWTCGSPAPLYAQLCLQPNDARPHPHVRLISPLPSSLHLRCRDFFDASETFNLLLPDCLHLPPNPLFLLPVCLSMCLHLCLSISPASPLVSVHVWGSRVDLLPTSPSLCGLSLSPADLCPSSLFSYLSPRLPLPFLWGLLSNCSAR